MHTDASEAVRGLIKKKDDVEAQIKALHEVLESQGNVGMKGELVDAEGFPRNDIDVFQVRTTRHSIICLQNDHKALMADIEEALHKLHAHQRKKHERDCMETQAAVAPAVAFARVDTVSPGSPASMAGLLQGDEVVTFGSVTPQNFQNLQNIATVVQHSERKPLRVSVLRGGSLVTLTLTPQRWSGRGLLGCNILPMAR
ncbi:26S proteasome non-ATPase regulatory subunit 9 isoform X1 [Petromyzon marinus]|uniref:26S proteasome non-ATPase regulatory subunit 9 n=1 Tax=Petromyzon marinus TaxID=7757 RepID=A0AAJ7XF79_PETMA|nr:26S proteasome non-ATPase regulatory subunit 9 isoform X1 [Petromyzon marinus]